MSNRFQASRWARYPILLHPDELLAFFNFFQIKTLFPLGRPLTVESQKLSVQEAVDFYTLCLERPAPFAWAALLDDPLALEKSTLSDGRILWMIQKPLLQIVPFSFVVSRSGDILPKAMSSSDAVFWGVEFLYPQLYQEPQSHEIRSLEKNHTLRHIPAWVREHSRPVLFSRGKEILKPPFRIGGQAIDLAAAKQDLLNYGLVCMNKHNNSLKNHD